MTTVRTRFAPSPTGSMHIGSLRTAIYAYALAKHDKGNFLLRIEDTDQKREVKGASEKIKQTLKNFNLNWDEEVVVQSDRAKQGIYKKAAQKLLDEGHAFYCQCEARNAKEGYSKELRDPCRDKNLNSGAVKLKVPDGKILEFTDFVLRKKVSWKSDVVPDTILLKSDGQLPTYHLAMPVDDHAMQISHVVRSAEWLTSTPIHLLVFEYLGYDLPQIGHPTAILDPSGGKLSKRKGNVSVEQFLEDGYLPQALLNFVILLGWASKDNRENYTLEEFVENFTIEGFQRSNPVFNTTKLDWFNGYYIRSKPAEQLLEALRPFIPEKDLDEDKLLKLVELSQERMKKLTEFWDMVKFVFLEPEKPEADLLTQDYKKHLELAKKVLEDSDWTKESLDENLIKQVKQNDFKTGDFFQDLRLAVTGRKISPPLNDCVVLMQKQTVINRVSRLL